MWRNACFCTMITLIALAFLVLNTATFLIPYKRLLFHSYRLPMLIYVALLTANLLYVYFAISRHFLKKDSGEKLKIAIDQIENGALDPELAAQLMEQE